MPSNSINQIISSDDGRLWIATEQGVKILNATEPKYKAFESRLQGLSIKSILFDGLKVFVASVDTLFIFERSDLHLTKSIVTTEMGVCRKLKLLFNTVWFISNTSLFKYHRETQRFLLYTAPIKNDKIFDLAIYKGELVGVTYPLGKIVVYQDGQFIEKKIIFNKNKLPLLCLAAKGDTLVIGGDRYYSILINNKVVFEKTLSILPKGIFSDNYAVWDIALVGNRIFLALGETHRNQYGYILEHGENEIGDNFKHYIQTLYYDTKHDALWIGTFNDGIYYWPSVGYTKQVGDKEYIKGESNGVDYFLDRGRLTIIDSAHKKGFPLFKDLHDFSTVKVIGDTSFIFLTLRLYIRNKGRIIDTIPLPYRYSKFIERIGDSLYCFGVYEKSLIINLRDHTTESIGKNFIVTGVVKESDRLIVHNKSLGFHVYDKKGFHELKYGKKGFEHIIDFTVRDGVLLILTGHELQEFSIDYSNYTLAFKRKMNLDSSLQDLKVKWILKDKEATVYLVTENGLLTYSNGMLSNYYFLGNRTLQNKPFIYDDSYINMISGGFSLSIPKDRINKHEALQMDSVLFPNEINEGLPFKIHFIANNYLNQNHALKEVRIIKDGHLITRKYAEGNIIEISPGLRSGTYQLESFVDGVLIKSEYLTVEKPLLKNPIFYYAVLFFVIIVMLLAIKNYRDRKIFNKQLLENRQKLLQQNFNPHFIYNTLNLIYSDILENDRNAAAETLMNFSKLHRLFLDRIQMNRITLKEELEFIKLYLSLENRRFKRDRKFDFEILNKQNIKLDAYSVPPNILQPLIENAIKHGLLTNDVAGDNLIVIDIEYSDGHLMLGIENPVGKIPILGAQGNLSSNLGMSIVQQRIELFNQEFGENIILTADAPLKYFKLGYRVKIRL